MKNTNFLEVSIGLIVGYLLAVLINKLLFNLEWAEAFTHMKTIRFFGLCLIVWGINTAMRNKKKI